MKGCGASACSPAQPHLHSGGAAPVTSASVTRCICWDTAGTLPVPRAGVPAPSISLPWAGEGQSLLDLGKPNPPKLHEQFPRGVSCGDSAGVGRRAAQEAAGVRPNQPCSLTGLGRAQERLKSLKPDSSPRLATLGPLSGHLCSIFFVVSKPRNLSFKLKLSPDYRCWVFERWP